MLKIKLRALLSSLRLLFLFAGVICSFYTPAAAVNGPQAELLTEVPLEDVSRMYLLDDYFGQGDNGVLLLRPERRQLSLYRLIGTQLRHIKRTSPWGYVAAASSFKHNGAQHIVVAYDYTKSQSLAYMQADNGRRFKKRLPRAIKVVMYDSEFDNEEIVFHEKLQQADVTYLRSFGHSLFLGYMIDSVLSQGGWLRREEGKWKFTREFGGEQQRYVDVRDSLVITGSPSLRREGSGSEVRLVQRNEYQDLPSHRGVSALKFAQLDEDEEPEILLADGLANQRTKRVESQLAVLDKTSKGYTRKKIAAARKGDKILEEVTVACEDSSVKVLTKGWTYYMMYEPEKNWRRTELYRKPAELAKLEIEFLPIRCTKRELIFALLENAEVRLMRYEFK